MFSFIYVEQVKNVSVCLKVASLFTRDISIGTQTLFSVKVFIACVWRKAVVMSLLQISHCKILFNVK